MAQRVVNVIRQYTTRRRRRHANLCLHIVTEYPFLSLCGAWVSWRLVKSTKVLLVRCMAAVAGKPIEGEGAYQFGDASAATLRATASALEGLIGKDLKDYR